MAKKRKQPIHRRMTPLEYLPLGLRKLLVGKRGKIDLQRFENYVFDFVDEQLIIKFHSRWDIRGSLFQNCPGRGTISIPVSDPDLQQLVIQLVRDKSDGQVILPDDWMVHQ